MRFTFTWHYYVNSGLVIIVVNLVDLYKQGKARLAAAPCGWQLDSHSTSFQSRICILLPNSIVTHWSNWILFWFLHYFTTLRRLRSLCVSVFIAMMLLTSFKNTVSTVASNDLRVYKSNFGHKVEWSSCGLFVAFIAMHISGPTSSFIQSLTVSA